MTKPWRRAAVASLAVALGALLATPAHASGVFSGGCTMYIDVDATAPIALTPSPMGLTLTGTGTCVVNGEIADMEFLGWLGTHPTFGGFGCASGVAAGTGLIDIDVLGFSGLTLEITVVATGAIVTMVATNSLLRFDGVAVLAQPPAEVAACPTSADADTTWKGGMAFQDPDFVPR